MSLRRTQSQQTASARAGFSASTGSRLDADPRVPSERIVRRGRRRPDPLASIWEAEIVPMLAATPGLRPVTGSFAQRYAKRHGPTRKSAETRRLREFSSPHFSLRFQDDFWGWNADRIPELFIGEVVLSEQVDVPP
jgi:hypothetical protein